jgi:hypothetical protein
MDSKPPVRWIEPYFAEDDLWQYFEIDEEGWVLRQVDLVGEYRTPTTAASRAELPRAHIDGLEAVQRYESEFGVLSDAPIPSGDLVPPIRDIGAELFEEIWIRARTRLSSRHGR